MRDSGNIRDIKGKGEQDNPRPPLESLRRAHGLEQRPPNLLTGEGMVHSNEFRRQLRERTNRSHFQKIIGEQSRSKHAEKMRQGIIDRCNQLRVAGGLSPSINATIQRIKIDSNYAYDKLIDSKKSNNKYISHKIRENACEVLCMKSDLLERLESKLQGGTKVELDKNLLEEAYTAFRHDVSKSPPEFNYRATAIIEEETIPVLEDIKQCISRLPLEWHNPLQQVLDNIIDKWNESEKWLSSMLYPEEGRSKDFEPRLGNLLRHQCQDFMDISKKVQEYGEIARRANEKAQVASSSSQGEGPIPPDAQGEGPIPLDALKDLNRYYTQYAEEMEQNPKNPFRDEPKNPFRDEPDN